MNKRLYVWGTGIWKDDFLYNNITSVDVNVDYSFVSDILGDDYSKNNKKPLSFS